MAVRGRKAKPLSLRIALGDHERGGLKGAPASPRAGVPDCPRWLDRVAREHWRWLVRELDVTGVVTMVDADAMAAYCDSWSRWRKAVTALQRKGLTQEVRDGNGNLRCVRQRPEVSIANVLLQSLHRSQVEFGLTPASRKRVVGSAVGSRTGPRIDGIAEKLGYSAQTG